MSIGKLSELVEREGLAGLLGSVTEVLRDASAGLPLRSLAENELSDVVSLAQDLREAAQALTAVVTGEAEARGSRADGGASPADWLQRATPAMDAQQAAEVARVAVAMRSPRWGPLAAKVVAGSASVAKAATIVRFHEEEIGVADPDQVHEIVTAMVRVCASVPVSELNRLAAHGRACLTRAGELDGQDARLRDRRALTKVATWAGLAEYRLVLDPEGAAVLDAALDPLPVPAPAPDGSRPRGAVGGVTDQRGEGRGAGNATGLTEGTEPATRRADALLELVARAMSFPTTGGRTPRTQLVVTMTLDALVGSATGGGVCGTDVVLSPATVRRLACEADIVPEVLGASPEMADPRWARRCFTSAQRRALAVRDGGCSFTACTIAPESCEVHHVLHWADGGDTEPANGALLCTRHHVLVHEQGLTAAVTERGVTWHR